MRAFWILAAGALLWQGTMAIAAAPADATRPEGAIVGDGSLPTVPDLGTPAGPLAGRPGVPVEPWSSVPAVAANPANLPDDEFGPTGVAAVPEPSAIILLVAGVAGAAGLLLSAWRRTEA